MAKFYGKIGYGIITESPANSGIWKPVITERYYYGDVSRITRRYESSGTLNDNLNINHTISIIADPFAMNNFTDMRYIEWMDKKWKVSSIEVAYPRLNLTISDVYNGGDSDGN